MTEIPQEFLSALSGDTAATMRFSALDEADKEKIITRAHSAVSAQEIHQIINRI